MRKLLLLLTALVVLGLPSPSYAWAWWIIGPVSDQSNLGENLSKKISAVEKSASEHAKFISWLQQLAELYAMYQNGQKAIANFGSYVQRFSDLGRKNWLGESIAPAGWQDVVNGNAFQRLGIRTQTDPNSLLNQADAAFFAPLNQLMDQTGKLQATVDSVSAVGMLRAIASGAQDSNAAVMAKMTREMAAINAEKFALRDHENNMVADKSNADQSKVKANKLGAITRDINVQNHQAEIDAAQLSSVSANGEAKLEALQKRVESKQRANDAATIASYHDD